LHRNASPTKPKPLNIVENYITRKTHFPFQFKTPQDQKVHSFGPNKYYIWNGFAVYSTETTEMEKINNGFDEGEVLRGFTFG
jgi:hypothetical protein